MGAYCFRNAVDTYRSDDKGQETPYPVKDADVLKWVAARDYIFSYHCAPSLTPYLFVPALRIAEEMLNGGVGEILLSEEDQRNVDHTQLKVARFDFAPDYDPIPSKIEKMTVHAVGLNERNKGKDLIKNLVNCGQLYVTSHDMMPANQKIVKMPTFEGSLVALQSSVNNHQDVVNRHLEQQAPPHIDVDPDVLAKRNKRQEQQGQHFADLLTRIRNSAKTKYIRPFDVNTRIVQFQGPAPVEPGHVDGPINKSTAPNSTKKPSVGKLKKVSIMVDGGRHASEGLIRKIGTNKYASLRLLIAWRETCLLFEDAALAKNIVCQLNKSYDTSQDDEKWWGDIEALVTSHKATVEWLDLHLYSMQTKNWPEALQFFTKDMTDQEKLTFLKK